MCFFVFGEPSLFSEDNDKRKIILLIERSTRFHLSLSFCKMRRRFCEKEARASLLQGAPVLWRSTRWHFLCQKKGYCNLTTQKMSGRVRVLVCSLHSFRQIDAQTPARHSLHVRPLSNGIFLQRLIWYFNLRNCVFSWRKAYCATKRSRKNPFFLGTHENPSNNGS